MNRRILIAAFACVSMIASAQSNGTNGQSSSATASSGQQGTASSQAGLTVRRKKNGSVPGKESSAPSAKNGSDDMHGNHKDGWNEVAGAKAKGSTPQNGVAKANSQAAKGAASAQTGGKDQHAAVTVHKEIDVATPKL
jgi:hypothetical protein